MRTATSWRQNHMNCLITVMLLILPLLSSIVTAFHVGSIVPPTPITTTTTPSSSTSASGSSSLTQHRCILFASRYPLDENHDENDHENDHEDGDFEGGHSLEELEEARKRFEATLRLTAQTTTNTPTKTVAPSQQQPQKKLGWEVTTSSSSAGTSTSSIITTPPMTPLGRKRRMHEIELLASLSESDDAIDPLVDLWLSWERTDDDVKELLKMERNCSPGLVQEESYLRQLIANERYHAGSDDGDNVDVDGENVDTESMIMSLLIGDAWVEPANRLATLLFMKGRIEESNRWCERVLERKPWHFEALHLRLMITMRLSADEADADASATSSSASASASAVVWKAAREVLPPLHGPRMSSRSGHRGRRHSTSRRRRAWVKRAVEQARESFHEAERNDQLRRMQMEDETGSCLFSLQTPPSSASTIETAGGISSSSSSSSTSSSSCWQ